MAGKNQHVVPHGDEWAVRGAGNSRITSFHPYKDEAIGAGREIAINQHSELVIHGRDGVIQDKDSFGHDPHPPTDKRH